MEMMKKFFRYTIISAMVFFTLSAFAGGEERLPQPEFTHRDTEMILPPPVLTHRPAPEHFGHHAGEVVVPPPPIPESFISFQHPYYQIHEHHIHLPGPRHTKIPPMKITLRDAILLALRYSPNVKSDELSRITDKYTLALEHYNFEPQHTFNINSSLSSESTATYTGTFSSKVNTPFGSTIALDFNTGFKKGTNSASITVTQNLLRGFGSINLIPWKNALDAEESAKLTFKDNIISVVIKVIQDYRQLVEDYNNLRVQKETLADAAESVRQAELKVKAGKIPESDLLQLRTNLESTRLQVVSQENSIQTNYQSLLSTLGLVPTAHFAIVKKIDYERYHIPDQEQSIRIALANNISYQKNIIALRADERDIRVAEDNRRWELNATGTVTTSDSGLSATGLMPFGPVTTGKITNSQSVMFSLSVPVDDFKAKVDLVNARIKLEQAKLALEQEKEVLVSSIITQVATLKTDLQTIKIGEETVRLQRLNLRNAELKLRFGKTTPFEVNGIREELLQQEISLIQNKIDYMNGVDNFYQTLGITLDEWNIKLRY